MKFFVALFTPWIWRMAWRDSRASRRKLLLFSSSIVIGIAALVAIGSLAHNMRLGIDRQAKGLLGADLVLTARDPFTPEMENLFREIGGEQAREVTFSSMVVFQRNGGTRLVQVRALGRGFPFYGEFQAMPANSTTNFHRGGSLVEETLLLQFDSKVGDKIKVGRLTLPILGSLEKVPGENVVFSTIAPRVYIPLEQLDATRLIREDSFAQFKIFFKLPESTNVEALVRQLRPRLQRLQLTADTIEERKASLGRALENLNRFLSLGGFIALLLGAIGIASAIHVHVKQKTASVAFLRCLGCSVAQTFAVYLIQATVIGIMGAVAGCFLGLGVQYLLPSVMADFLPFQIDLELAWQPILRAVSVGLAVCLIFAILPLLALRRVSPLAVLRTFYEPRSSLRDLGQWLMMFAALACLLWLARGQVGRWDFAFGLATGLGGAFALLALVAQSLRWTVRKIIAPGWPFVLRQGMANLYRPQNRTLLLLLSLGLGVFLILALYRTNQILSTGLLPKDREKQPNAALFDIQDDQVEGIRSILSSNNLPLLQNVPVITMRLRSIKGVSVTDLMRDGSRNHSRWALQQEYRSTYRDTIDISEKLVAGKWPAEKRIDGVIPVSIEKRIADNLQLTMGDRFVFDVQGILLTNEIAALRTVDWRRIQPNFFFVFPSGILEKAPGFHILTTRVPSRETSAAMQRAVVQMFPNVSVIDLTIVLDTLDTILGKIRLVVQFMTLFTVGTGVIVLVVSVLTGRYQRIQETILLRTLGASRKQVYRILISEYFLLGFLAALTGIVLAEGGTWALAKFVFEAEYNFTLPPMIVAVISVTTLTILTGVVANRGVLDSPPLEIIRGTV